MITKLERKFGRYAIPNLTMYLVVSYVIGYVLSLIGGNILYFIALEPTLILRGQVWRLVTWLIMPPGFSNIFIMFLMLFIYYQFGTILEKTWGVFRYNLYIFSGIILTIIGAFLAKFILNALGMTFLSMSYSTYYIATSIFLAVAAMYPEMEVRLYFIIPIKFKWAALIDVAFLVYACMSAAKTGSVSIVVMIVASLLNLALMLHLFKNSSPYRASQNAKRKREFQAKMNAGRQQRTTYTSASGVVTKHKCAICGRTELDGDELEFRFCSKCNGNYEYCQDHLFTHTHIK
jgi:uncharacterized membrane protein YeaQ/YmgE (transglycosylase-associated protein family)